MGKNFRKSQGGFLTDTVCTHTEEANSLKLQSVFPVCPLPVINYFFTLISQQLPPPTTSSQDCDYSFALL